MNYDFVVTEKEIDDKMTHSRDWNIEQDRPRADKRDEYEQGGKKPNCNETGLVSRKPL